MRSILKKWLLILSIWTIAGLLYGAQSYYYRSSVGQEVSLASVLLYDTSFFVLWTFFTPLLITLARRFPLERSRWISRSLVHLILAIALAFVQRLFFNAIFMPMRQTPSRPFTWESLYLSTVATFDYGVLIYFIVMFVCHALDYYQQLQAEQTRSARMQAELATAQLKSLQMQLHPHFLFNTLNTIAVLIREDPPAANRMVELLSDLLRHTLQNSSLPEVTLRNELEFLRNYLQIEQTRFGDRLRIEMKIDSGTLDALVPNLILQPLVENAIRHGVAKHRKSGLVEIAAEQKNGELHLQIRNTCGSLITPPSDWNGEGVGLRNTRRRLQSLYGDAGRLELSVTENNEVLASVIMPLRVFRQIPPTDRNNPTDAKQSNTT